jgi:carbon starvation protein CstA
MKIVTFPLIFIITSSDYKFHSARYKFSDLLNWYFKSHFTDLVPAAAMSSSWERKLAFRLEDSFRYQLHLFFGTRA